MNVSSDEGYITVGLWSTDRECVIEWVVKRSIALKVSVLVHCMENYFKEGEKNIVFSIKFNVDHDDPQVENILMVLDV